MILLPIILCSTSNALKESTVVSPKLTSSVAAMSKRQFVFPPQALLAVVWNEVLGNVKLFTKIGV